MLPQEAEKIRAPVRGCMVDGWWGGGVLNYALYVGLTTEAGVRISSRITHSVIRPATGWWGGENYPPLSPP